MTHFSPREVQAVALLASGLCVGAAAEYSGLHRMDVVRLVNRLNRCGWGIDALRTTVRGLPRAGIESRIEALLRRLPFPKGSAA